MLWQRTLVASILAAGAQAGLSDLIMEGLTQGNAGMERRLEGMAKANIRARGFLEARQAEVGAAAGSAPLKPDGSLDMEAWNTAANAACREALQSLQLATNPSGACVCYNLPLLNNVTGTFEADLRLFQLNEPTGLFQGIPQGTIEVELFYNGASVTEVSQQPVSSAGVRARQVSINNGTAAADQGNLRLLQSYLFVGQVDKDQMKDEVTTAQLQALVMPVVTLKATNANGQIVTTNVSSNEAAFVVGVFSKDVVMSNFRMAELAVEAEIERLTNGTVAFVLPGVQLMIFPIGLIITSVWLVLGIGAYGMGTYARYNFREAHKRRMAVAQKGGMARI
ncbi:hypothetical protein C8A05DRAFT_32880 [Staphylotrichum tortipilum]|uniref:Uncharacterized protein n=1 Tax=Staphylotrichum tortipilum TaxID=2831512 RepID=A0AAN6RV89_9PEZI|nr:hypothetical protein C8A05DRAFT_32880 [Staphylotrichum longicolle]